MCRRGLRRSAGSAQDRCPEPAVLVVKNGTNRFDVSGSPVPSSSMTVDLAAVVTPGPVDPDAAAGLERRVDRVADDVDQQLLELIGIGRRSERRRRRQPPPAAAFPARRSGATSAADCERPPLRLGQSRELRVGAQEAAERAATAFRSASARPGFRRRAACRRRARSSACSCARST